MSAGMPKRARLLARIVVTVALFSLAVFGLPSAMAASASQKRVGAVPRYPAGAHSVGSLPASTRIPVLVALSPRDPSALARYAAAVSDRRSSLYHHYLTVA